MSFRASSVAIQFIQPLLPALPLPRPGGCRFHRFLNLHGDVTTLEAQSTLVSFVERLLQQSSDGSGKRIDGVMVLGAPPSRAHHHIMGSCSCVSIHKDGAPVPCLSDSLSIFTAGRHLVLPEDVSDRLECVRSVKAALARADLVADSLVVLYQSIRDACTRAAVPSCLLMTSPWSEEQIQVRYSQAERDAYAKHLRQQGAFRIKRKAQEAADAELVDEDILLGLQQRELVTRRLCGAPGGYLSITKHYQCAYGETGQGQGSSDAMRWQSCWP